MDSVRAVVVDHRSVACLNIANVPPPEPRPNDAIVRVHAISLNRGEVRRAQEAPDGSRIGYDFAGIVETPATDGSGPKVGERVVGVLPTQNAWSELVAVRPSLIARLPENVSFEQAATLPVAGLTALYALDRGGALLGKRVLVTGASGGVGHLAVQLAREGGAIVTGVVRQAAHVPLIEEAGARTVIVDETGDAVAAGGPYDIVLESVGGPLLAAALTSLAEGGVCVHFGASASRTVTFESPRFFRSGRTVLYGLYLFTEFGDKPASEGLARLARLVSEGRLRPLIERQGSWSQIGEVAQALLDRQYRSKAVLRVD
jgi:NADPH:quinone reductase-like Zn-dependent oxidoreductase